MGEAIGFAEVASSIGKAIGEDVEYVPVPHEAAKEAMVGMGVPEWIVDGYVELSIGFENNFANTTTDGVATLAMRRAASSSSRSILAACGSGSWIGSVSPGSNLRLR